MAGESSTPRGRLAQPFEPIRQLRPLGLPRRRAGRPAARTARCSGRSVRGRHPRDRSPRRGSTRRRSLCCPHRPRSRRGWAGWLRARASKTPKSTSLGTVLKAHTTRASGTLFASSSAPEVVWAMTSPVSSSFIGSEQVRITFPDRSPACARTSSTRDQCTASRRASASCAASRGVPARAFPWASRASRSSFSWWRA